MALGYMRRHKRLLYVFLWIVILGMIVYFIPFFQGEDEGSPGQTVATVGGRRISVAEFQRALEARRDQVERQLEQMGGRRRRPNREQIRQMVPAERVLQELVDERALRLEVERLGLYVDDQTLVRHLQEQFQEDGRFIGAEGLRGIAQRQSWTLEEFEEKYRLALMQRALESLITAGVDVTDAEAEQQFRQQNERVRLEYAIVDVARHRAEVTVTDEDVRARFDASKEKYRIPERRVVAHLLVDRMALRARTAVTDTEIEKYYRERTDEFRQEGQVCASHILVYAKSGPTGQGHAEDEARKLAQGLLDKLKGGADFAELAKKSSEEKLTAPRGGDRGCFPAGEMPPEFDDAVSGLEAGQLSDLVRTTHGYHIIRLNSRSEETTLPLPQVKDRVRTVLLDQRAAAAFEAATNAIADELQRGGKLEDAAKTQSLTVQKSVPIARGQTVEPLSPAAAARAFEMKPGEVDAAGHPVPKGRVFLSLLEVQPSRIPEMKESQEAVRSDLVQEKALEAARVKAAELKAQAEKAGLAKAAAALGLARKEMPGLVGRGQPWGELGSAYALEEAAYALPENALSDPVRIASGYAVLGVLEKKPFDPAAFEKEKPSILASLREGKRRSLFQAYLYVIRQRFPVQVRVDVLKRVAG